MLFTVIGTFRDANEPSIMMRMSLTVGESQGARWLRHDKESSVMLLLDAKTPLRSVIKPMHFIVDRSLDSLRGPDKCHRAICALGS